MFTKLCMAATSQMAEISNVQRLKSIRLNIINHIRNNQFDQALSLIKSLPANDRYIIAREVFKRSFGETNTTLLLYIIQHSPDHQELAEALLKDLSGEQLFHIATVRPHRNKPYFTPLNVALDMALITTAKALIEPQNSDQRAKLCTLPGRSLETTVLDFCYEEITQILIKDLSIDQIFEILMTTQTTNNRTFYPLLSFLDKASIRFLRGFFIDFSAERRVTISLKPTRVSNAFLADVINNGESDLALQVLNDITSQQSLEISLAVVGFNYISNYSGISLLKYALLKAEDPVVNALVKYSSDVEIDQVLSQDKDILPLLVLRNAFQNRNLASYAMTKELPLKKILLKAIQSEFPDFGLELVLTHGLPIEDLNLDLNERKDLLLAAEVKILAKTLFNLTYIDSKKTTAYLKTIDNLMKGFSTDEKRNALILPKSYANPEHALIVKANTFKNVKLENWLQEQGILMPDIQINQAVYQEVPDSAQNSSCFHLRWN